MKEHHVKNFVFQYKKHIIKISDQMMHYQARLNRHDYERNGSALDCHAA